MVYCGLQHLALRREPEAIVNEFGIFRHQLVFQMRRAAIQRDAFNAAMGTGVDFATRRFIHTARFHTNETVLDQIKTANAMRAAKLIKRCQQCCWRHRFAVQGNAVTLFKIDGDIFRRIGRILWIDRTRIDIIRRFIPRIFKHLAFRRCVQEVRIRRKRTFAALVLRHGYLVLLGPFY